MVYPVMKKEMLDKLEEKIEECKYCPFAKDRTNIVPGTGSVDAEIMFIGEAPGKNEDEQGEPFVGRSGKILRWAIASVFEEAEQTYFIANTLKCRPTNNRDPKQDEREYCRKFLDWQVKIIDPDVIITVGGVAAKEIIQEDFAITKVPIKKYYKVVFADKKHLVFPAVHPSYYLRQGKRQPAKMRKRFKYISELLKHLETKRVINEAKAF